MSINGKYFLKYLFVSTTYLFMLILFVFLSDFNEQWILNCFSDKIFIFQYSILFFLGCNLIDNHYNKFSYSRFKNRKEIVISHSIMYFFLSLLLSCLWLLIILMLSFFANVKYSFETILYLLKNYFRFLLGLILIGEVSINFLYTNFKKIVLNPHIITFLFVFFELYIFIPLIKSLFQLRISIFFSWIFIDNIFISCCMVFILIGFSLRFVIFKIKKTDMII